MAKRIIPCLDVHQGKVVKGVNFKGLKEVGDPIALAKKYAKTGADELVFLDISASYEERKSNYEVIARVAQEIFIPFCVGGGISELKDITHLLDLGVDKVSINSAGVKNPSFIEEVAKKFGSQCIVVAIDVKRTFKSASTWSVFLKGGREDSGRDLGEWASEVCDRGAGEILLTSMDADGVKNGFDIECLKFVRNLANVPIIASGGAGGMRDFLEIFKEENHQSLADAGLAASIFHQDSIDIGALKSYLRSQNIPMRI